MKLFKLYLREDQLNDLLKLIRKKYPKEPKGKLAKEIRDAVDEHLALNKPTLLSMQKARKAKGRK